MPITQVYTAQSGDTITAARWNNEFGNIYSNVASTSDQVKLQSSAKGSLPSAGTAGRIARVSDDVRGVWMDTGTQWISLQRNTVDISEFATAGAGTSGSPWTGWDTAISWTANRVYVFREGYFQFASGIVLNDHGIHILGTGRRATQVKFAPSANGTAFQFKLSTASTLDSCSFGNLTLFSTDTTYTKVGVDLVDVESFHFHDVVIGASDNWSGATSIALRVKGRQSSVIERALLNADIPLDIQDNPNTTIDIDHFTFRDLYLLGVGTTNPLVRIATGINLTDVHFEGYQAWVKGSDGLKWIDTTTAQTSQDLTLDNIRWEQGGTGYTVDIEHNSDMQNLSIRGGQGPSTGANGFKFRKVINLDIDNFFYTRAGGDALNVDSTVKEIFIRNCFWQAGSTATITGQRILYAVPLNPNTGAIPPTIIYGEAANASRQSVSDVIQTGTSTSIAQDATTTIGPATFQGFVFVTTDENTSAIYLLRGSTATTAEVSDADAVFTVTADSATSYNIYHTGGNYVIQNKRTGTHKVRWLLIGAMSF